NIAKYYKGTKSRSIEVQIAPDIPLIHGVRDQLVQIFFNLILNAVDATPKGGRIRISSETAGPGVEVRISDNGSGIALADQHRLFQPYFTTKRHGTGLGLFVCRKLIADHGGSIDFESQPNNETVFRVRLAVGQQAVFPRIVPLMRTENAYSP